MKSVFFKILLTIIFLAAMLKMSFAAEQAVSQDYKPKEIGVIDLSTHLTRITGFACNDDYLFLAGYVLQANRERTIRKPYLIVFNLKDSEKGVTAQIELERNIFHMVAVGNYLYAAYFLEPAKPPSKLAVFDISDAKNIKQIEPQDGKGIYFNSEVWALLANNESLIYLGFKSPYKNLKKTVFCKMDIKTDPANPKIISNSFSDNGDQSLQYDIDEIIKKAKIFDSKYMYVLFENSEILVFDIENIEIKSSKSDETKKDSLAGKRIRLVGNCVEGYKPLNEIFDNVYDFDMSKVENERAPELYLFAVGTKEYSFDVEKKMVGNETYDYPIEKHGIQTIRMIHTPRYGEDRLTLTTLPLRCDLEELSFHPYLIYAKGNWIYIFGIKYIYGSDEKDLKSTGCVCVIDASDPDNVQIIGTYELSWFPRKIIKGIGDVLYVLDVESKIHELSINLEPKPFVKAFKPVTEEEKKQSRVLFKNASPQGYWMIYRSTGNVKNYTVYRNFENRPKEIFWFQDEVKFLIVRNFFEVPDEIRMRISGTMCGTGT